MTTLILRTLYEDDLATAHRLSQEAGWPHRQEDWRLFLSVGHGVAAVDGDGALIGTAMWWPYGAEAATIGMVLVSKAARGRGIGRRLMQDVLGAVNGRRLMLNATREGLRLYEAMGFRTVGMIHQHQGMIAAPESAAQPLETAQHRRAIELDSAAFGAPRTALMMRLLNLGQGVANTDGFALRRAFGRGRTIGPVIAANEEQAIAHVSSLLASGFFRIDVPADATRLAGWLVGNGLPAVSAATVMIRGDWPASSGPRRFGLVSQALG